MKKQKKLTPKQVRQKWVEALRSGEYKQGQTLLHYREKKDRVDRFCCLGVLCDLAVKAGVIEKPGVFTGEDDKTTYDYNGVDAILPDAVVQWAGLSDDEGMFTPNSGLRLKRTEITEEWSGQDVSRLTKLNDDGRTFKFIAKVIEAEPEGLVNEETK